LKIRDIVAKEALKYPISFNKADQIIIEVCKILDKSPDTTEDNEGEISYIKGLVRGIISRPIISMPS
jgi:hypothetical protein